MPNVHRNAEALHQPYPRPDAYHALAMPIYHTASFDFETAEAMEEAFCGRSDDYLYSRIANPTVQHLEGRVRTLTDARHVMAFGSGMAAISNALMTLAAAGQNIVASRHLFGNTVSFLSSTLSAFGVTTRFVDLTDVEQVKQAIDENTCALFLEVLTNPQLEVTDLRLLSALAHSRGVPVVADTTLIPFTAFSAKALGVDIELVSSTKYISGGGTSLGGLLIDYGQFDWRTNRKLVPNATTTSSIDAFNTRLRSEVARNLGALLSPHAAYMQLLGLETLAIRYTQQSTTCLTIAEALSQWPEVKAVNYTGLKNNPYHALATAQYGALQGAMLTFDLDSKAHCYTLMNKLQCIRRATNLFEHKSLIIHPASTIYGNFTPVQRAAMCIHDTTLRLSVGLEPAELLLQDLAQALGH
ncbi:MAG: PLP-dependent transferase [Bacteroidales bacterium]|nr:PLP-dependent transferase [Bacteroidales bacterium]